MTDVLDVNDLEEVMNRNPLLQEVDPEGLLELAEVAVELADLRETNVNLLIGHLIDQLESERRPLAKAMHGRLRRIIDDAIAKVDPEVGVIDRDWSPTQLPETMRTDDGSTYEVSA